MNRFEMSGEARLIMYANILHNWFDIEADLLTIDSFTLLELLKQKDSKLLKLIED